MKRYRPKTRDLQVSGLRRRFGLPKHRARLLAELAYGSAS